LLGQDRPARERVCSTYHWSEGRYQKYWDNESAPETPFFRASGGVFCTSRDYSKFLAMWMDGGLAGETRILPESTVVSALQPGPLSQDYGMHWEVYYPGETGSLPSAFGHGGSDGTLALALPEHNAMVLYFTQSRGSLSTMFLEKMILQELGYSEEKHLPEYVPATDSASSYMGDFDLGGERWTVEPGDGGGIVFKVDRLVPLRFVPVAEHTFEHPILDMGLRFVVEDDGTCGELVFRSVDREISARRLSTSE
jgi:CubicO group peptidase (beta-lactamase class C family)